MTDAGAGDTLLYLLHLVGHRADALFSKHLGGRRLMPRQFMVLETIAAKPGLSQTDIMTATGLSRSSTADIVHGLVVKGYIERYRAGRGRRASLGLTPSGSDILYLSRRIARKVDEALTARMPTAEIKLLRQALSCLREPRVI